MLNKYKRYQKGLSLPQLFPQKDKRLCACGCGKKLVGRKKRWASKECQENAILFFFIIKGDTSIIRKELYKRDKGICAYCKSKHSNWEADHIISVFLGGGASPLDNFQTLCKSCHLDKTKKSYNCSHHNAISSHADEI